MTDENGGRSPGGRTPRGTFATGNTLSPGRPIGAARYQRSLTAAVREGIAPETLRDYFLAIVMGRDPRIEVDPDSDDGFSVMWPESGGLAPTLEQRSSAARWLAERGWGSTPQLVQVEADLRTHGASDHGLNFAALSPAVLLAVRDALRAGTMGALPAPGPTTIDDALQHETK